MHLRWRRICSITYVDSLGIDTAESSYLDFLFETKFVLKHPDDAEAFISSAYEGFQRNGYILQADNYEYKREVYPLQMMLRLNSIIGAGVIMLA